MSYSSHRTSLCTCQHDASRLSILFSIHLSLALKSLFFRAFQHKYSLRSYISELSSTAILVKVTHIGAGWNFCNRDGGELEETIPTLSKFNRSEFYSAVTSIFSRLCVLPLWFSVLCQHCIRLYAEDKRSPQIEIKSKAYDKADQNSTVSAVRTFALSRSVRGDVIETLEQAT